MPFILGWHNPFFMESTTKIGIGLSGGGARGIAHVGVLQALLENGIYPEVVSGTSAGAIVGALYAAGYAPGEMLNFVKDSSIFKIFRVVLPNDGLTRLTYLRDRLEAYIEEDDFAALHKKLYIAITNLITGELEIRHSGRLFDVVVASSSIPLVFKPVEIDEGIYVDGGVLDNLPVTPLLDEADFIIGVNVMPHLPTKAKSVQNVFGIATRVFDMSIWANTRPNLRHIDLLLEPEGVYDYNIFAFNKHQALYEIGYAYTLEQMDRIKSAIAAATGPAVEQ